MVDFSHIPVFKASFLFQMSIRAFHPVCPFAIFHDDGDVPFRDAIHHKYSIKIPKQRVILLRIEWKTGW